MFLYPCIYLYRSLMCSMWNNKSSRSLSSLNITYVQASWAVLNLAWSNPENKAKFHSCDVEASLNAVISDESLPEKARDKAREALAKLWNTLVDRGLSLWTREYYARIISILGLRLQTQRCVILGLYSSIVLLCLYISLMANSYCLFRVCVCRKVMLIIMIIFMTNDTWL